MLLTDRQTSMGQNSIRARSDGGNHHSWSAVLHMQCIMEADWLAQLLPQCLMQWSNA